MDDGWIVGWSVFPIHGLSLIGDLKCSADRNNGSHHSKTILRFWLDGWIVGRSVGPIHGLSSIRDLKCAVPACGNKASHYRVANLDIWNGWMVGR